MRIKAKMIETVEDVYDLFRDGKYKIRLSFFEKKKGINIQLSKPKDRTRTIKWQSKNR